MDQEIRYCTSFDGTRIAYSVTGDRNNPPLVRVATWLTHLEFDWESPIWRPWLDELGRDFFLVRYDPRGVGLSDRNPKEISFEAWVKDLERVADAAGLEKFAVLGLSQGGAVGIEYSLRHPERVKQLILWGAFSVGWTRRGRVSAEERDSLLTVIRQGWGRRSPAYRAILTNLFVPDASEQQMQWFNELQRKSMTADSAVRYMIEVGDVDIVEKLPLVTAPTLIMHSREDSLIPYEEGRSLAASIPGARFVTLESRNHVLLEKDVSWPKAFHEVRTFCGIAEKPATMTAERPKVQKRRLAVVMFADMVGYTALAQKDESLALKTLKELRALLRPIFSEFAGVEIKTMGDAFLVEFGSTLEATRCALRIQRELKTRSGDEKITLRVGIHLGDVEEEGGDILGDAVNIASRLEPLAKPGSICISQQVYDQIRNRVEFSFNSLGERQLKNIEAPLAIYEVKDVVEQERTRAV